MSKLLIMLDVHKLLFIKPAEWFVWKPERIFVVSCAFFFGYCVMRLFGRKLSSLRSWPLLIPAITWGLYAIWEWFCAIKKYNIRVDLLLIYPVLIAVSVFSLLASFGSLIFKFFKK